MPCEASLWISTTSSASSSPNSPLCSFGATIRCPDAYGNLFRRTKARSPRWTMSPSSSEPSSARQKMQPSCSSALPTYSSRQGAQSGRVIEPSEPALVAEEREHPRDQADGGRDDDPEVQGRGRSRIASAGEPDVHAPEARDQRRRQEHDAEDGQDPQHVVEPV